MRDPYEILGVPRGATPDDIKKAYRRLARELHPDRDTGNPHAEEAFKELSAAYDLLSDAGRRARFDRGEIDADGRRRGRGRGPAGGAHRARGPFDRFFRQRDARAGAGIKVKGTNVTYSIAVDFIEAARGTTKRIQLANAKALDVRIPPGTDNGRVLRLKGQGTSGIGGGEPGDALVEVTVRPHPIFRREGDDVHTELQVTLGEAILGGRIEAPTIDGMVAVTVPEGSNTGTILRLRAKGQPRADGGRGDQLVHLKVVLPANPDRDLVAFVRTWAARNPYHVRPRDAESA